MKNLLSHALSSDRPVEDSDGRRGVLRAGARAHEATERVLRDLFWRSQPGAVEGSVMSLADARAKKLSRPPR
jgi:hypothetical protein